MRLPSCTKGSAWHQDHRKAATPHPSQALIWGSLKGGPGDRDETQNARPQTGQPFELCLGKNQEYGADQNLLNRPGPQKAPPPLGPRPTRAQSRLVQQHSPKGGRPFQHLSWIGHICNAHMSSDLNKPVIKDSIFF